MGGPAPATRSQPTAVLCATGQMWRGAHVPDQFYQIVQNNAEREKPARIVGMGTSSGAVSLLGAAYAASLPREGRSAQAGVDRELIRTLWRGFGERTGGLKNITHPLGYPLRFASWFFGDYLSGLPEGGHVDEMPMPMPQRDALEWIFDQIDWGRVYRGGTEGGVPLVTVATRSHFFDGQGRKAVRSGWKLLGEGLRFFFTTDPDRHARLAEEHAAAMIQATHDIFEPVYFSTDPEMVRRLKGTQEFSRQEVYHAGSPEVLRAAVEASVCIPFTFTMGFQGYEVGGLGRLFDGVWSEGAPAELALAAGANQVYIFNDARTPSVRRREVQWNLVDAGYRVTRAFRKAAEFVQMDKIPWLRRGPRALKGAEGALADLRLPMDLAAICQAHERPPSAIKVIGLPEDYPGDDVSNFLGRFYLGDQEVIENVIRAGERQANAIAGEIAALEARPG